jgi:Flp pilus assembly protein TadB
VTTQQGRTADSSFAELVGQFSTQTSRLVRDEIRLAQKELQQSAAYAGKGAGLLTAATVFAGLGALTAVAALVAALALVLPVWAAAAIVAVALFIIAGVAALVSRREIEHVVPTAPRTVDNIKHDVQEVKEASHGSH